MKKRYLKTAEDVLALKDTETKIYVEDESGYYKFVNGVLCAFDDEDNSWSICSTLYGPAEIYILEEEPTQEASKDDIGKLCWFTENNGEEFVAVLEDYDTGCGLRYECCCGWYNCCRPLTKEEIKEFMEKAE